jgi:hypothetical protein
MDLYFVGGVVGMSWRWSSLEGCDGCFEGMFEGNRDIEGDQEDEDLKRAMQASLAESTPRAAAPVKRVVVQDDDQDLNPAIQASLRESAREHQATSTHVEQYEPQQAIT